MSYTLNQAAKATGKSKSTINAAIKKGRVSAIKSDDGSWDIDPAELHRVYPPVSDEQNNRTPKNEHQNTNNLIRLKELEVKLEASQERCGLLESQLEDLKEDRDEWRSQSKKQTLLLTAAQEQEKPLPPSFWQRLTGRRTG